MLVAFKGVYAYHLNVALILLYVFWRWFYIFAVLERAALVQNKSVPLVTGHRSRLSSQFDMEFGGSAMDVWKQGPRYSLKILQGRVWQQKESGKERPRKKENGVNKEDWFCDEAAGEMMFYILWWDNLLLSRWAGTDSKNSELAGKNAVYALQSNPAITDIHLQIFFIVIIRNENDILQRDHWK